MRVVLGDCWRAPLGEHMGATRGSWCLLAPPALGESLHSSLARRLVAVCRRAVLMMPKGQRPEPRLYRRGGGSHDAADNGALGENIVIVVAPFAGWARVRRALEDQIVLVH